MKFIVVGYLGQYGSMGQWVVDILRNLGHEVEAVDRNSYIPVQKAVYFFVDCSEDYSQFMPEISYPKIFWSMDAHMPGGLERAKNIANKCDLVISSNYEYGVKLLETVGIQSYLVPITYRYDYFIEQPIKKKYDVVMIGNPNSGERVRLWDMLKEYNSFIGATNDFGVYCNAMVNAKIVINQPTEPWDNILNNRFFEALGCGAVLLQKKLQTSLIEKLGFEEGKDFLYWNTLDELPTMIDTVLANYKEYEPLAMSGNDKVQKYEMENQLEKIVSLTLSKFYDSV
jgi:hypothetical protein